MWSRREKEKREVEKTMIKIIITNTVEKQGQKTSFLLLPLHMTIMAVNYIF
ncbi:MAG TPA: hypothetical protein VE223_07100 [Nitrososphaeraceae archaeon]|nr:hypothetical protein [Nitrososphaeraceae archaeon]